MLPFPAGPASSVPKKMGGPRRNGTRHDLLEPTTGEAGAGKAN